MVDFYDEQGGEGGDGAYEGMIDDIYDSIRPDFNQSGDNSAASRRKAARAERGSNAADSLRNGEKGASSSLSSSEKSAGRQGAQSGGIGAARNAEGGGDIPFTGSGKDGKGKSKGGKAGLLGFLQGKGPIGLIVSMVLGVGGLSLGSTSLAPFSLVNNALDQFNVLRTSMNTRSKYYMRYQTATSEGRNRSITKSSTKFNLNDPNYPLVYSKEKFKISRSTAKKLNKNGIELISYGNGGKYLRFTDPDTGEVIHVVADASDLGSVPTDGASRVATLEDAMNTNMNFYKAEEVSTRTMKGHITGWFESLSEKFHSRIENTRNRFKETSNAEVGDDTIRNKAKSSGLADESGTGGDVRTYEDEIDTNNDGSPDQKTGLKEYGDDETRLKVGDADVEASLTSRAKKASAALSGGVNVICGVMNVLGTINLAITALQMAQILNYVTGFLEAVQKTQMGDGGSELQYYMNQLSADGVTEDIDGNKVSGSAMSSTAYNVFFGGVAVSSGDGMAKKYNKDQVASTAINKSLGDSYLGSLLGGALTSATWSVAQFQTCTMARMTAAGIELALDLGGIIVGIFTGGIGALVETFVKNLVKEALIATVMAAAVYIVTTYIVPQVARMLAKDLISNMVGQDAAYAINSGANLYMGKQMEANSGGAGTAEAVSAMYKQTQEVIASEAKYERSVRSPFDVTSQYTFLGSIVNSLIPIGTAIQTSLPSSVSSLMDVAASSVRSIFPTVSAASDETWYHLSYNNNCPTLSSMGLVGDAYCNPYYVTDLTTIDDDPYDVLVTIEDQFETDSNGKGKLTIYDTKDTDGNDTQIGIPVIDNDSDLGKYIVACTTRDSQYGIVDSGIAYWMSYTGNSTADMAISTATSIIPVAGAAEDMASAAIESANLKWTSGAACVADSSVNPDWSTYKYFQRFIEDQTLLESEGLIKESAVTAFLDKYYEENPIDNSIEGIIARYSGLSYDEVDFVLGLVEYSEWISNYDATTLYPTPVTEDDYSVVSFSDDSFLEKVYSNSLMSAIDNTVFDELRNRYVVV